MVTMYSTEYLGMYLRVVTGQSRYGPTQNTISDESIHQTLPRQQSDA